MSKTHIFIKPSSVGAKLLIFIRLFNTNFNLTNPFTLNP